MRRDRPPTVALDSRREDRLTPLSKGVVQKDGAHGFTDLGSCAPELFGLLESGAVCPSPNASGDQQRRVSAARPQESPASLRLNHIWRLVAPRLAPRDVSTSKDAASSHRNEIGSMMEGWRRS